MCNILFKLGENLVDVLVVAETYDDLQLFPLDIWRVVVLAEKDANVVLKNIGAPLQDQIDVPERYILDLWS